MLRPVKVEAHLSPTPYPARDFYRVIYRVRRTQIYGLAVPDTHESPKSYHMVNKSKAQIIVEKGYRKDTIKIRYRKYDTWLFNKR